MDYEKYFEEELSDWEILRSFRVSLQYLKKLIREDVAFGLSDTENNIYYEPAESFDLNVQSGKGVLPIVKNCINTGKIQTSDLPASVLGKSIKIITVPIKNSNGKVIGTVSTGINQEFSSHLVNIINEISESLEQVSYGVTDLADEATQLAHSGQTAIELAKMTIENSKETTQALEIIQGIANKINLLGLNAAIESARAGEHGKGFSVVSSEIRSLAIQSKEAVTTIQSIIEKMNNSVNSITDAINESASVSEEQAAAVEEISATIESINQNMSTLTKFSKDFLQR